MTELTNTTKVYNEEVNGVLKVKPKAEVTQIGNFIIGNNLLLNNIINLFLYTNCRPHNR